MTFSHLDERNKGENEETARGVNNYVTMVMNEGDENEGVRVKRGRN